MEYILIVILLFGLSYHYDYKGNTAYRKEWYIIMMIVFILLAGLRYRVGIDTINYMEDYEDIPSLDELHNFDFSSTRYGVGYIFLASIAKCISSDFVVLQLIVAIFVNTTIFWFFKNNTNNIFLAILIFFALQFTNFCFEIMRESCSVAMFLIAWPYLVKRSWIKYYLCCIGAVLLHPSGLVTLFVPLLTFKFFKPFFKPGIRTIILYFCVYGIFIILNKVFFNWITLIGIASLDSYAQIYENTHYAEIRVFNYKGLIITIFNVMYPLGSILLLRSKHLVTKGVWRHIKNYRVTLSTMVVVYLYFNAASNGIYLLYRFMNYFIMFFIVVLANVNFREFKWERVRYKFSYGVWMSVLIPFLLLRVMASLGQTLGDTGMKRLHRYYPYNSVLNPKEDKNREKLFELEKMQ